MSPRALLAVGGVVLALLGGGPALADVAPPEGAVPDRVEKIALVFAFAYALTVLCEFLVVRAQLFSHLAWRGATRGHLLGLVATVNAITLPLVFAVLYVLGERHVSGEVAIPVAETIPFLAEPALYAFGFRRHVRLENLEAAPPGRAVWVASLLANVVSVVAGITVALGVSALLD